MAEKTFDPYSIIRYPLATEKTLRLMESENKLVFVVDKKAKKPEVKKAIELAFNTKVVAVNMHNTMHGQKRAYVKFAKDKPAIDIATQLGLM